MWSIANEIKQLDTQAKLQARLVKLARFLPGASSAYKPFTNPPPPEAPPGERLMLTVSDEGGWGYGTCADSEAQVLLLVLLRKMDVSLWVSHEVGGDIQVVEDGKPTQILMAARPYLPQGEVVVFTATGPDARRALLLCRSLLTAAPAERKEIALEWLQDMRPSLRRRRAGIGAPAEGCSLVDTSRPTEGVGRIGRAGGVR